MAIIKIPILDANNIVREVAFEDTPEGLKPVHEITGTVVVPGSATEATVLTLATEATAATLATEATAADIKSAVEALATGQAGDPISVAGLAALATEATASSAVSAIAAQAKGTVADPAIVRHSGSILDLRGLISERPAASVGNRGATWWAVDRVGQVDEVSVSTGSGWVNL